MVVDGGGLLSISGPQAVNAASATNAGTIILVGASVDFGAGGLDNNGTLALIDSNVTGTVTSPAGSAINVIGTGTFNDLVSGAGGIFGSGMAVFNGGHSPGDSSATVSVEGSLVYGSTNTLTIELGGLLSGEFDRLEIGGDATLGGNLVVEVFNGFTPSTGDIFPILVAGDINGTFDNESLPSGYAWGVDYNATMLSLEVLALLGDMDGDDNLTSADIPLFVQALVNRAAYDAAFPALDADLIGDMNQDGTFDLGDLSSFSTLLVGPASANAQAVPEPSALTLATFALLGLAYARRKQL